MQLEQTRRGVFIGIAIAIIIAVHRDCSWCLTRHTSDLWLIWGLDLWSIPSWSGSCQWSAVDLWLICASNLWFICEQSMLRWSAHCRAKGVHLKCNELDPDHWWMHWWSRRMNCWMRLQCTYYHNDSIDLVASCYSKFVSYHMRNDESCTCFWARHWRTTSKGSTMIDAKKRSTKT